MKDYLKLLRVTHYIKNLLIFIPLFFSKEIFIQERLVSALLGVVCFSLVSSAVYILNDIKDIEKDRKHSTKKNRPIASGRVSQKTAIAVLLLCLVISAGLSILLLNTKGISILIIYFLLNVAYSLGLKNKPIIDVFILASGFLLRIIYGGILTDVEVSKYLYLVVIAAALFMGLGKRRNELKVQKDTREVLRYYTEAFLDKNAYVCVALIIVFYTLWTVESENSLTVWTVPLVIAILMKYSLDIEGESDGDPIEVLLHDKMLVILTLLYGIAIFIILYVI